MLWLIGAAGLVAVASPSAASAEVQRYVFSDENEPDVVTANGIFRVARENARERKGPWHVVVLRPDKPRRFLPQFDRLLEPVPGYRGRGRNIVRYVGSYVTAGGGWVAVTRQLMEANYESSYTHYATHGTTIELARERSLETKTLLKCGELDGASFRPATRITGSTLVFSGSCNGRHVAVRDLRSGATRRVKVGAHLIRYEVNGDYLMAFSGRDSFRAPYGSPVVRVFNWRTGELISRFAPVRLDHATVANDGRLIVQYGETSRLAHERPGFQEGCTEDSQVALLDPAGGQSPLSVECPGRVRFAFRPDSSDLIIGRKGTVGAASLGRSPDAPSIAVRSQVEGSCFGTDCFAGPSHVVYFRDLPGSTNYAIFVEPWGEFLAHGRR